MSSFVFCCRLIVRNKKIKEKQEGVERKGAVSKGDRRQGGGGWMGPDMTAILTVCRYWKLPPSPATPTLTSRCLSLCVLMFNFLSQARCCLSSIQHILSWPSPAPLPLYRFNATTNSHFDKLSHTLLQPAPLSILHLLYPFPFHIFRISLPLWDH